MTDWDPEAFTRNLIADMRANNGEATTGPLAGQPLLILTTTGAKTGQPRVAILTASRDGDDLVVAGSKSGDPTDPAWLHNLVANPLVQVEANGETFQARASIAESVERERLWDNHVERLPHFAEYPERAGRVIPMVKLTRVS